MVNIDYFLFIASHCHTDDVRRMDDTDASTGEKRD